MVHHFIKKQSSLLMIVLAVIVLVGVGVYTGSILWSSGTGPVQAVAVPQTDLTFGTMSLVPMYGPQLPRVTGVMFTRDGLQIDPSQLLYGNVPSDGSAPYATVARWEKNPLTYSFNNCPRYVDCGQAHQAVREAVEAWDAVSGIGLNEVAEGGDIRIGWYVGDHGTGQSFDGPGGILGYAYFPLSWLGDLAGDIFFDDDEEWVFGSPATSQQIHLKTVAMHEAGHSLGLDHTTDPSAVMYAEYSGPRNLSPDDIAGIQALYGQPGSTPEGGQGGETPPQEPSAPADVTATTTTTIRLRTGPGTGYPSLGNVPANVTVNVHGRNSASTWIYVEYSGTRGWIAAWLCIINGSLANVPVVDPDGGENPPPSPPENPTPEPENPSPNPPADPGDVTAYSNTTLRIRRGPGTGYAQVGTLPANTVVEVYGRDGGNLWLYIKYDTDKFGWVAAWLANVRGDLNTVPVVDPDGNPLPTGEPMILPGSWLEDLLGYSHTWALNIELLNSEVVW